MPTISIGVDDSPGLPASHALVQDGATLYVEIGIDRDFTPDSDGHPDLPPNQYPALVDTGAIESCIDYRLAERLGLPIVDRKVVSGVHGAAEVNYHLAQIYVPSLGFTAHGGFAGVHLVDGGQPYQALLGRTFLMHFKMVYDGRTGEVTISSD